jgi:glycosyltransferase involved in cell wall biosynthesis
MKVLVTTESRFDRTPDGCVWTTGWADYSFWKRYLDVFEEVCVVARVRQAASPPTASVRADGLALTFKPLPYYIGPWQFARRYHALRCAVRDAVRPPAAVILRVPGTIGTLVEEAVRDTGRPFAVEVVGDPRQVFKPGGVPTRLRPFFRWWTPRALRRQCATACASAYVTAKTLQQHYPPAAHFFSTGCSDIDLGDEAFVDCPRPPQAASEPWRILLVGSLEQLYKGPDVLVEATAKCVAMGLKVCVTIVGDGRYRAQLEELARTYGVAPQVCFAGKLPSGAAVRTQLDDSDLFVLPSRTEGLPRALLEAMARALPCVGSSVGGIPELLSPSELVTAGDSSALARKLQEVLTDPQRLARLSEENLSKAREFHRDVLRPRRRRFYEVVKEATLTWLARTH